MTQMELFAAPVVVTTDPTPGRPWWLGSGEGWGYLGRNGHDWPVYRRRVLHNGMDMWQTKSAGGRPLLGISESFTHYDGPEDQRQFREIWRDHYVDGDPNKGFVGLDNEQGMLTHAR